MMCRLLYSFRAIWISIALIGLVELSCWLIAPPPPLAASNFLELAYLKLENMSKLALMLRTRWSISLRPDILQVGDSSGLHNVMPVVVNNYLDGLNYVNDNLTAEIGYFGHVNVAEAVFDHTDSVKAIVLYVTPLAKPAFYGNAGRDLERSFAASFLGPWHYFSNPTLGYRTGVTNLVYYGRWDNETPNGITGFLGDADWRANFFAQNGFVARETKYPVPEPLPLGECSFALWFTRLPDGRTAFDYFYAGLEKMAKLARRRHVRLMVVFNPVPCREDRNAPTLTIERELARFRADYPEVVMPLPFLTTWPAERFMDGRHFASWAAKINSELLGPEIVRMIKDPKYTGVAPPPLAKLDAELAKARGVIERPASCEKSVQPGGTDKDGVFANCIGLSFVTLPAGQFMMGSCDSGDNCPAGALPDTAAHPNEMRAHRVVVKRPFQMAVTPVTVAQFQRFLNNPQATSDAEQTAALAIDQQFQSVNLDGDDQRPVTMITWDNAQAFVRWLNKIKPASDTGTYRLPSEAEWEYGARSGSQTAYWWGADPGIEMANCTGCTKRFDAKRSPVASFKENPFGLYDMNGNVWEWTEDCFRGWYGSEDTDTRAHEQPDCLSRTLRGGSFDMSPSWSRAASRFSVFQTHRNPIIGFRVVRDIDPR